MRFSFSHAPSRSLRHSRAGFTLIELLISMVLGVIVLAVSTNFATATLRSSRGSDLRDGLNRDARFVGLAISRDLQDAGVAFESTQPFGSVATRGDTVLAISVPFLPNQAEVYNMVVPADTTDPLPPGGTCGATCIDVVDPNVVPFQVHVGDVALLQVQNERRLIVLTQVTAPAAGVKRLTFSNADTLFVYPAGLTGGLRLTRNGVAVQRLSVSAWYRNAADSTLMRADGFTLGGQLRTSVAARGIETFSTRLLFTNGLERTQANGFDSDTTNDYNRIVSVVVRARMRVDRVDRSVNGGAPLFREYEWRVSPRNLTFERNRVL
jgi:prepilin-type N-terminal cleavage/methylation domain-containing protein